MIHSRRLWPVLVALLCIPWVSAGAGGPGAKRAKIVELMELTGSKSIGDQVAQVFAQQLSTAMQEANPNIPPRAHEIVRDVTVEILKEHSHELFDRIIPLYEKNFSESEIDEILVFYRTPTAQKALKLFPVLIQEIAPISEAWAQDLSPIIDKRLRERLAAEGLAN